MEPQNQQAGQPLDPLGLGFQGNAHELDQLMQEGIRDVLGGSQGSLLPIPGLPEGAALPIVDQHGNLRLGSLELPPLPGEPDVASQVRDTNCSAPRRQAPPSAPMSEEEVDQDDDDDDDEEEPGNGGANGACVEVGNETGSSGRPGRGVKRKKGGKGGKRTAAPGMQGRFSGRLGTKEDEKRLAAECRLIGPLLGGAARGEKSLHTLAKIVRAVAAGSVRAHLEAQDAELKDLRAKLLLLSDGDGQQLMRLQDENTRLRRELAANQHRVNELEHQLGAVNSKLQQALSQAPGMQGQAAPHNMHRISSLPVLPSNAPGSLAYAGAAASGLTLPAATAAMPNTLPMPTVVSVPANGAAPPQLMLGSAPLPALTASQLVPAAATGLAAPAGAVATTTAQLAASIQPNGLALPDATAAAVAAQQQVQALTGVQPTSQVVVSMAGNGAAPAMQPLLMQTANGGLQHIQQQPSVTSLSGGALAPPKPAMTTVSEALSGEAGAGGGMQANLLPATTQPQLSGPGDSGPVAAAADQAAQNLNQQAQHLSVQASLHGQAKTHATSQAQQLASQAQLHAQASVQAAVQAEQLKQTLAAAVLPDTQQAQQAVVTVQNLEERAKAHADITTQAVAQARELQEKAQAHAAEQAKAMAQANMLQAHAQSLAHSAQQLEASAQQNSAPNSGPAAAPAVSGELMVVAPANPMQQVVMTPAPAPTVPATAAAVAAAAGATPAQQQPAASVNRPDGGMPELGSFMPGATDATGAGGPSAGQQQVQAVAPQQQLQQTMLAAAPVTSAPPPAVPAASAPPAAATTMVPAQLPNGQTVQVLLPQNMVAQASGSMAAQGSGSVAQPVMPAVMAPALPQQSMLQQQQSLLQPSLGPSGMTAPMAGAPSNDSAMHQTPSAQQTAQLQEQLAVLQQAQAQQHAVQQQAAAVAAHHQAAAAAVQEQLAAANLQQMQAAHAAHAAAQAAVETQQQLHAAQAAQAAAQAAADSQQQQQQAQQAAATAAQDQMNLATAVAHQQAAQQAMQQAAQQQAAQQAAQQQHVAAAAAAAQDQLNLAASMQQQQQVLQVQVDVVPQQPAQQTAMQAGAGNAPVPAAASAILQPTPQALQKSQSHHYVEVKVEALGSSAVPTSSANAAAFMEALSAGRRGSTPGVMPARAPSPMPASAGPGSGAALDGSRAPQALPGPEVSTGLTPQVGVLDLPPGIETIVPSDQPLTADPSVLQAVADMGPVVALPASSLPQAPSSLLSLPHSASEGLPVASGSSM